MIFIAPREYVLPERDADDRRHEHEKQRDEHEHDEPYAGIVPVMRVLRLHSVFFAGRYKKLTAHA